MGDGNWLEESPNGFISEISRSTLPRAFYLAMPLDNAEPFVYETHNYNNNHKRGGRYWYKFMLNGQLVRESNEAGSDRKAATWKRRTVRPSRTDWWVSARRRPFRYWQTL